MTAAKSTADYQDSTAVGQRPKVAGLFAQLEDEAVKGG